MWIAEKTLTRWERQEWLPTQLGYFHGTLGVVCILDIPGLLGGVASWVERRFTRQEVQRFNVFSGIFHWNFPGILEDLEKRRKWKDSGYVTFKCMYDYNIYIFFYTYRRKSIDVLFYRLLQDVLFQNAIATYTWCCVQTNGVHTAKARGERRWLASPQKRPMQITHGKKVPSTGPHHSGTNDRSAYWMFVCFVHHLPA